MSKKVIIFALAIIVVIGVLVIGYKTGEDKGKEIGFQAGRKAGWEAAKKRLVEEGFTPPEEKLTPVKAIFGKIEKIEEGKIYLKTKPLSPLADPDLDLRIVEFDNETEVIKEVHRKETLPPGTNLEPGHLVKQEKTDIFALKAGQFIIATAEEENIRNKKQFRAWRIIIKTSL